MSGIEVTNNPTPTRTAVAARTPTPTNAPIDGPTPESAAGTAEHNKAIVNGVFWQGTLRWVAQVLAWSATIIIARRLSPEDYGIAGVATLLVSFFALVTEGGLGRALVMRREYDQMIVRQAHGASILLGVGLALIMLVLAYPIAQFYGEPQLSALVAVLSLALVFSGYNAIPTALLMQRLQYRRMAAADFSKTLAQGIVVIVGALLGFGPWALTIGLLTGYATASVLLRIWSPLQPMRPTRQQLASSSEYARHLVVGSSAWFLYSNSDFAVVGRVAGLSALGYYQFAWNVAQLPGEKLANVLQAVVGPFFGAIGDDHKSLRHYFLLLSELLASVMLPVLAGFALVAHVAIALIFGDKWLPSVTIMEILVLSSALSSMSLLSQHVLVTTGNASVTSRLNLIAAVVMPVSFYAAAKLSGHVAVACVWLIAQPVLVTIPLFYVRRAIGLPVRTFFASLRAPALSAFVMTLCVLVVRYFVSPLSPLVQLLAMSVSGAVVYTAFFYLVFPDRVRAIVGVWKTRG